MGKGAKAKCFSAVEVEAAAQFAAERATCLLALHRTLQAQLEAVRAATWHRKRHLSVLALHRVTL